MRLPPPSTSLPLLAVVVPAGLAVAIALGIQPGRPAFVLVLVAAWVAGTARGPWWRHALAVIVLAASIGLIALRVSPKPLVDFAYECVFAFGAMAVGIVFGRTAERAAVASARLRKAQADQDEATRQAAITERARIVLELHDVIGHSLSVMMLQGGGARVRLERGDVAAARDALSAVEDLGHRALADMRRMLGLLRRDTPPESPSLSPGLARLPELVREADSSGVAVELTERELPESLPFATDVAAYRLIESALAAAVSAEARGAKVAVRQQGNAVEVELRSEGEGRRLKSESIQAADAALRQRVEIYRGSVTIEDDRGQGRIVRALLPVAEQTV